MRKRNHRVQFMLNDSEYHRLTRNAAKSGFKIAGYLRLLICAYVPKELPPLHYYELMNQLYKIATQIDQMKHNSNDPARANEHDLLFTSIKQMIISLHHEFFDMERIP